MKRALTVLLLFLLYVDSVILLGFQIASLWVERLTGRDCFHLRSFCFLVCAFLAALGTLALPWHYRRATAGWWIVTAFCALSTLWYVFVALAPRPDDERLRRGCVLNPRFMSKPDAFHRLVMLCWGLLWSFRWHADIFSLIPFCYGAALYFDACTPLPPGQSKVRQWLREVRASLSVRPVGAEV